MRATDHVDQQRAFYDSREHGHLQTWEGDLYAAKLARKLAVRLGIGPSHRVLEVGAGFGRFTFPLLSHCGAILAVDLSAKALNRLEVARGEREIPEARCRTLCGDLDTLDVEALGGPFDFVVGFFLLHHLHDFATSIAGLAKLLAPGGRMAFIEPNRRNPAFLAQVACCADMTWAEEKGMFRLSRAKVERAYRASGLTPLARNAFGFFPPQLFNRFAWARSLEDGLEVVRVFDPILPFLLLAAESRGE